MSPTKTIYVVCLLFLLALGFISFGSSQTIPNGSAQTTQGENAQTMQTLLNEVRQLRLAIHRSTLSAHHAQAIIERMRSQQQLVERLTDRLRETRDRIANLKLGQIDLQAELKRSEGRLSRDNRQADAVEEENQEIVKTRLGFLAQEEARMREQESQIVAQLPIEQARLAELNDRLDALQRELETPPAENKPPQGAKRQ
jgi:chromosome segregation ATPase